MKKKTLIIGSALAAVLVLGGTGAAVAANGANDDAPLTGTTLEKASKAALAKTGEGRVTDSETDDDGYEIEVTLDDGSDVDVWLDESFTVVRVDADDDDSDDNGSTGNGSNGSTGSDDDDRALTADERASVEKAALAEVPGTVTEVDRSDDGGHAYEVEVTRADGTQAEVELDAKFAVVHVDEDGADDDNADDNNDADDRDDN